MAKRAKLKPDDKAGAESGDRGEGRAAARKRAAEGGAMNKRRKQIDALLADFEEEVQTKEMTKEVVQKVSSTLGRHPRHMRRKLQGLQKMVSGTLTILNERGILTEYAVGEPFDPADVRAVERVRDEVRRRLEAIPTGPPMKGGRPRKLPAYAERYIDALVVNLKMPRTHARLMVEKRYSDLLHRLHPIAVKQP